LLVLALLALCGWAYASRPAPGAMMPLFVGFLGLGAYLVVRLLEAWNERTLLVRDGRPVAAIVVSVSGQSNGKARFVGWYQAGDRQWSVEWTDRADSAEVGDTVTALYMPGDPGRVVAYRAAGCKAVETPNSEHIPADQSPLTPRI